MELKFKQLPFTPEQGQVIYIESEYNKKLNKFIRNHYESLKSDFAEKGLRFCYLPLLAEETIRYNAPYVGRERLKQLASQVSSLSKFAIGAESIEPSLVFAINLPVTDESGNIILQCVPIRTKWYMPTTLTFLSLINEIKSIEKSQYDHYIKVDRIRKAKEALDAKKEEEKRAKWIAEMNLFRQKEQKNPEEAKDNREDVKFSISISPGSLDADDTFDEESLKLIESIRKKIEALRNKGVNTMILHSLIDEGEKISRLKITKDYRIFLVDYDNKEIKMTPLPKAVFILFLRHPEGIAFKNLMDYFKELARIYKRLNDGELDSSQYQSIYRIANPFDNSINEKCARIREAFVSCIDERLAKNYFVTGMRGEPKRITLDRSMVIWE
jgi:hypothetical protein